MSIDAFSVITLSSLQFFDSLSDIFMVTIHQNVEFDVDKAVDLVNELDRYLVSSAHGQRYQVKLTGSQFLCLPAQRRHFWFFFTSHPFSKSVMYLEHLKQIRSVSFGTGPADRLGNTEFRLKERISNAYRAPSCTYSRHGVFNGDMQKKRRREKKDA